MDYPRIVLWDETDAGAMPAQPAEALEAAASQAGKNIGPDNNVLPFARTRTPSHRRPGARRPAISGGR
jgi:hypothetical protein